MPVISLVNAKGGSGKTTTSFLLADRFSAAGYNTCLVDTDPNGAINTWNEGRGPDQGKAPFDVIHVVEERDIVSTLQNASSKYEIVIVDTEGTAHVSVTRVLSRTHLALLPLNGSILDAHQAARVVELVTREAEMLRMHIEFRLLFSRLGAAVMTKSTKDLREDMKGAGLPVMDNYLNERRAYRDVFQYSCTLSELLANASADHAQAVELEKKTLANSLKKQIEGYEKAIVNADQLVHEVIDLLADMAASGKAAE